MYRRGIAVKWLGEALNRLQVDFAAEIKAYIELVAAACALRLHQHTVTIRSIIHDYTLDPTGRQLDDKPHITIPTSPYKRLSTFISLEINTGPGAVVNSSTTSVLENTCSVPAGARSPVCLVVDALAANGPDFYLKERT
ncbi:hypothetical protein V8E54_011880 [Elaphomyces granulatus]